VADAPWHNAVAHPSLALAKYWGKRLGGINIPATTSIAITLSALSSTTRARVRPLSDGDRISIDGVPADLRRFAPLFDALRDWVRVHGGTPTAYEVESENSFPTAAGLASSSSGIAALVTSVAKASRVEVALDDEATRVELSALARIGSGSASRSVFGGYTRWKAGASAAEQILPVDWWPDLRVVVLPVARAPKPISSRDAMNLTRDTSPYYAQWVADAETGAKDVEHALREREIRSLGEAMRRSTMRMFATMLAANPPIIYWSPETIAVLRELDRARRDGVPAYETIDAGPQVKVATLAPYVDAVIDRTRAWTAADPIECMAGEGAR
jgi:diphosphomevalonate decarboxylase